MAEISRPFAKGKVLIVEDETRLRSAMGTVIRQEGYLADEAGTGEEALELLARTPYDLMTLDMVMPGMGGVEVIQRARQIRPEVSIIVLTAHPTVDSAIVAVKADVTDYLIKPCTLEDLLLTIARTMQERARQQQQQRLLEMVGEAIDTLRQSAARDRPEPGLPTTVPQPISVERYLQVGPITLDREKRTATLNTNPPRTVELTESEVAILTTLMASPNQVFTYSRLADTALGYKGMDKWTVENIIRSSVFRLRQKIDVGAEGQQLIRTVRGRGYFFALT